MKCITLVVIALALVGASATTCTSDPECDDGMECTIDSCNDGACAHFPMGGMPCGNGGTCDQTGVCQGDTGGCVGNADCHDDNDCTDDICTGGVCTNPARDGELCNGGLGQCTSAGSCEAFTHGGCSSDDECNDNLECTLDGCNFQTGDCVFVPQTGDPCNAGAGTCDNVGICNDNECATDSECDDGDDCTNDTCDNGSCMNAIAAGTICNAGAGMCSSTGSCEPTNNGGCNGDQDCDDGNECTMDSCMEGSCMNTDMSGNSCNGGSGTCNGGTCETNTGCSSNADCGAGMVCMTDGSCSMDPCSQAPVQGLFRFNDGTIDMLATEDCAGTSYQCDATTPTRTASGRTYYLVAQWNNVPNVQSC